MLAVVRFGIFPVRKRHLLRCGTSGSRVVDVEGAVCSNKQRRWRPLVVAASSGLQNGESGSVCSVWLKFASEKLMFGQSNYLVKMLHTSYVFCMLQILSFKY